MSQSNIPKRAREIFVKYGVNPVHQELFNNECIKIVAVRYKLKYLKIYVDDEEMKELFDMNEAAKLICERIVNKYNIHRADFRELFELFRIKADTQFKSLMKDEAFLSMLMSSGSDLSDLF